MKVSWAFHLFSGWLRQQDPLSWVLRTIKAFLLYKLFFCMFAIHDIHHGCIRRRDHICVKTIAVIRYTRKLPKLYCVYYVCLASIACSLARSSGSDMIDDLASFGCSIFYNNIVDPISHYFDSSNLDSEHVRPRKHFQDRSNIPGRHNGCRAAKRGRTRHPPYRRSCHRTFRQSTKSPSPPKPRPPDLTPTCWTYFANECLLAKECLFREFQSTIQECHTANQECIKCARCFNKLLQHCFSILPIYNFYFSVVPLDVPSTSQRRSEEDNKQPGIHSFLFVGKPTSNNDARNVHFTAETERHLDNIEINITGDGKHCHSEWLVGDSGAGCSIIANPKLLTNIRDAPHSLTIHCNSGRMVTKQIGDLKGFGVVWYHPGGIANIVALCEIAKKHRVTMDSSVDNALYVHKDDGTMRRFVCTKSGVYCCNLRDKNKYVFNITTIEQQEEQYSALDVERATRDHGIYL